MRSLPEIKMPRRKNKSREPMQLGLFQHGRRPDGRHGGWRPGAGRPKAAPTIVRHRTRTKHRAYQPAHVTLRLAPGLPSIRRRAFGFRTAVARAHKDGFRICQISFQRNHIHLIVEADDNVALARGVQGFAVRVARRVNRFLRRSGKVFAERYHVRALKTPQTVRNALVYVLFNNKHHGQPGWEIDRFSSARWFDGIAERPPDASASPVASAQTWLWRKGWRQLGLIHLWECPAT